MMLVSMVYENERFMNAKFRLRVWDNFHYMDESEAFDHGEFDTYEEALAAAMQIVEESVAHHGFKMEEYAMFGDDSGIICPPGDSQPLFSARDYARELCEKHKNAEGM
jgi:hypothetical protein